MDTLKERARFLSALFTTGKPTTRSKDEWSYLLNGAITHATDQKILIQASPSEIDGFEGLFGFGSGLKTYSLLRHSGQIIGIPADGVGPNYRVADNCRSCSEQIQLNCFP